jgi:RecQ family ATP-dependent DNA helicase
LDRFRDGQLAVVQAALTGRSLLVVSPTGFGKTLCFQLPAVLRRGVSVVISPLKALMGEQVSSLLRRKIPSSYINSDIGPDEKRLRYRLLASNHLKLLYVAPERFFVQSTNEQQQLRSVRPAFLVVDEAHCVDQWGRDFRPEYGRLKEVREALGSPPILAFTATAGQEMQKRILASLGVPDAQVFVRGVDRPNIALLRWSVSINLRPWAIEQLCRVQMPAKGKVMIFVPTRKIGTALQKYLGEHGLETPFYHSQFDKPWDREQLLKRFVGDSRPEVDRIICTSAFGMGLDVPNVRMSFIGSIRPRLRITCKNSDEPAETARPLSRCFSTIATIHNVILVSCSLWPTEQLRARDCRLSRPRPRRATRPFKSIEWQV